MHSNVTSKVGLTLAGPPCNSTLQCGSPGPPDDGLQSNKVYDTAATGYTDQGVLAII